MLIFCLLPTASSTPAQPSSQTTELEQPVSEDSENESERDSDSSDMDQDLRKRPYKSMLTASDFQNNSSPPRPCIIVTKEEIFLLQRPFDENGDSDDPILMMRNPLFPPTLVFNPNPLETTYGEEYHREFFSSFPPHFN